MSEIHAPSFGSLTLNVQKASLHGHRKGFYTGQQMVISTEIA